MKNIKMYRISIIAGTLISLVFNCQAQLMIDIAQPANLPVNSPKYSDVVMRSLSFRNDSFAHGSTLQNALDFHVTRLDWVYVVEGDENFMKVFAAKGIKVGGTINATPADSTISVKDIHGKAREASWLPGRYFICVNNPGALKYNLDRIKTGVDLGCIAIQRDEPGFGNIESTKTCCFCTYCREKAKAQGVDLNDSAQRKAFNKASTIEFYKKLYTEANLYAGFPLAHSCNGGARSWDDENYAEIFNEHDYRIAEMRNKTPSEVYMLSRETRLRNKAQLFQYTTRGEMDNTIQRQYIAISYATGMNVMVPWDVYISRAPRYFGTREDFADVFGFVRCIGQAGYLDGYQDAAIGGFDLDETRYKINPLGIISGNDRVSLFARTIPGNAGAPVIVHLVNWGGSGPVKIKLLSDSFFKGKALNIKLWTPKPYNLSGHTKAENSGNYENLKWDRTKDLKVVVKGIWTEVDIPELSTWGILVVR